MGVKLFDSLRSLEFIKVGIPYRAVTVLGVILCSALYCTCRFRLLSVSETAASIDRVFLSA